MILTYLLSISGITALIWFLCYLTLRFPKRALIVYSIYAAFLLTHLPVLAQRTERTSGTARSSSTAASSRASASNRNPISSAYSATAECPTTGPTWTREGFGAAVTGGCQSGQRVITVNTLSDSGAAVDGDCDDADCSLRDAVQETGTALLIRFAVSGWIVLTGELEITKPNLTIDGGDAPNQGVGIRGNAVRIRASNVIYQYMRGRIGPTADPADIDNLSVNRQPPEIGGADVSNVYIRHCSFTWGDDGNLDVNGGVSLVTIVDCILAENMGSGNSLIAAGGDGCTGDSEGDPTRVTDLRNIYYNGSRNTEVNQGRYQHINCVHYWGANTPNDLCQTLTYFTTYEGSFIQAELRGNDYDCNPINGAFQAANHKQVKIATTPCNPSLFATVYLSGNIGPSRPNIGLPETDILEIDGGSGGQVAGTPFAGFPSVSVMSAADARTHAIANAGATQPCRDAVDTRIANAVSTRSTYGKFEEVDWNPGVNPPDAWPDLTQPCSGGGGGGGAAAMVIEEQHTGRNGVALMLIAPLLLIGLASVRRRRR